MRLSDIIGHTDLAFWPIIAMVLFLGVFIAVILRILGRSRRNFAADASLSLEDGVLAPSSGGLANANPGSPRASQHPRSARP